MNTALTTRKVRLLSLALAGGVLVLTPGCLLFDGQFAVNVDGSTDVQVTVAMGRALMEQAQQEAGDPVDDLAKEPPEGWIVQPYDTDEWHGARLQRHAMPGEDLIPPAGGKRSTMDDVKVSMTQRLLCTDYQVAGKISFSDLGPGDEQASATPRVVFVQDAQANEGPAGAEDQMPDLGAMGGLLGALAQRPQLTLRIKAPGSVLSTTGNAGENGVTVWDVPIRSDGMLQAPEDLVIRHVTRLVNQQNVGRLADRLAAEKDVPDMASVIADYVARDLLPNPPKADPLKASLDAQAYHDALSIIAMLEDAVGPQVAQRVVVGLKLNADSVTAKQLADLWAVMSQADQDELVGIVADGLIMYLRSLRR